MLDADTAAVPGKSGELKHLARVGRWSLSGSRWQPSPGWTWEVVAQSVQKAWEARFRGVREPGEEV
jgi:hypothetical protein